MNYIEFLFNNRIFKILDIIEFVVNCLLCALEDSLSIIDVWFALKTQKSKFVIQMYLLTFNVSILLNFGKNEHQYVSKTCFNFYAK